MQNRYDFRQSIANAELPVVLENTSRGFKRVFASSYPLRIGAFIIFLIFCFYLFNFHNELSKDKPLFIDSMHSNEHQHGRDLKHVNELSRIKTSVSNELRDLENKKFKIQEDILTQQTSLNTITQSVKKANYDLDALKRQILQMKIERHEAENPKIVAPVRLLASDEDDIDISPPKNYHSCEMQTCFDYSRCSLSSQFPVYVYSHTSDIAAADKSPFSVNSFILDSTTEVFRTNAYVTIIPENACLYVVVLGEVETDGQYRTGLNSDEISQWLQSLAYWHGDGRNHMLLYLSKYSTNQNPLHNVNTGRAIVAQSNFALNQFRSDFDLVVPTFTVIGNIRQHDGSITLEQEEHSNIKEEWLNEKSLWNDNTIPMQVPANREYILSFQGQLNEDLNNNMVQDPVIGEKSSSRFYDVLLESFRQMESNKLNQKYLLQTKCSEERLITRGFGWEWSLCGSHFTRASILGQSTFSLIISPDHSMSSSALVLNRLTESLRSGAVPVVLGTKKSLPFSEHIVWEKAALIVPQARITELSYLLSTFPDADILALRRHGRFLYDTYLSSVPVILDTILATIRSRLLIPPLAIEDTTSEIIPHASYKVQDHDPSPGDAQSEFGIPPPESQKNSPKFTRNFTGVTLHSQESWNSLPGPFHLYSNLPTDDLVSTDAQFIGSANGYRPTGGGTGGTGKVFQETLGGNSPHEQFTIVMLTYERDDVLVEAIQRLVGLPYLNKVVVVWNSPSLPGNDIKWPDIGPEVVIVDPGKNSLNNRFIPYDVIQTEAVLSLDDDVHLRHDEILFGFRVWREARHRLVGFPGRFHAWDAKHHNWNYNSNHTCELSMVLPGAAFFHKHYMYLYTYWMPPVIREIIDEYMNCEDIALNFLISHITRQPPLKVTSRWTFRCPGCPVALSTSQEHFEERHKCINKFVKAFGYMPLMFTQFRVDSVLFKTRLPHDKQKCFKFI